jgi:hypothetical protein
MSAFARNSDMTSSTLLKAGFETGHGNQILTNIQHAEMTKWINKQQNSHYGTCFHVQMIRNHPDTASEIAL